MGINQTVHMKLYISILDMLDSEGRWLLLNEMVNHLRYPNICTFFFHLAITNIFDNAPETSRNEIREIIIRILVERLIVHLPHPWGLSYTYKCIIEMVKIKETETGAVPPFMQDK